MLLWKTRTSELWSHWSYINCKHAGRRVAFTEIAHVFHIWSFKNNCILSHVRHVCLGQVLHMLNFTCYFSHVTLQMWSVLAYTCAWFVQLVCHKSHVKFPWSEISFSYVKIHVKLHMWKLTYEKITCKSHSFWAQHVVLEFCQVKHQYIFR